MAHAFFLGIDALPNEDANSTGVTLALIEKSKEPDDAESTYRLDHIRHHSEKTAADDLADHLQGLVAERPYIGRTTLIVNRGTEDGQALFDALEDRGLTPVAVTLTGEDGAPAGTTDDRGVRLKRADAVRTLVNLYRDYRLSFEEYATESASRLARDVQGLSEVLDEAEGDTEVSGTAQAAPSVDPNDTHLTSAALAAWLGTERSFDPSQHLKETPQTNPSSPNPGTV